MPQRSTRATTSPQLSTHLLSLRSYSRNKRRPVGRLGKAGRRGFARHHRLVEVRRPGTGILAPYIGHGRALPCFGLCRTLLRRAFESLREPNPPPRYRRPEAKVPPRPHLREEGRQSCHERAGKRASAGLSRLHRVELTRRSIFIGAMSSA